MKKASHALLFTFVVSAVLLPAFALQHEPIGKRGAIEVRALIVPETSATASLPSTAAGASSSTQAAATSASPAQPTTAATTSTDSTPTTPSSSPVTSAAATHASSAPASSAPPSVATTAIPTTATNSEGQAVTSYIISTATVTSPSGVPSHTDASNGSDSSGLSTGSIVGLSVAGGIAALGIILFFVWKFTRKRFADFDDNEAIKWPELNSHNNDVHALPTNATGRAGFGPENDSDINLVRAASPSGAYANSIAASSVPEVYGAGDPYAVPPLPHLNPNQPYRDEPGTFGQPATYYDPYRGPVPNTFSEPVADGHGTESIPMTQMARMRSPGPQVAYDMQGRGSPTPQAALGYASADERSRTPNPPGSPHLGYGYGPR